MTYRINGKAVTREEFFQGAKGFDYSKGFQIARDYEAYNCPITGNLIDGRAAHRENLKRNNCRIFEPGERESFVKNRERDIERNANEMADFLTHRIAEQF